MPYIGAALKQVSIKRMEDYLSGKFFGMSMMLWPINSHSLLIYIKMQSVLVRCSSSIVTESKGKQLTDFVGKDWNNSKFNPSLYCHSQAKFLLYV